MWNRILLIVRTHLAGEWMGERGARLPVAPVLFQFSLAAVLCGLARDSVPPFAYGVFALSIPLALTTLSLLGELGPLLRADPATEWIGAQPVRPIELRAARVSVIAVLLGGLAAGALLPAALLAPAGTGWIGRVAIFVGGLALTFFGAAVVLWLQRLFVDRAEGILIAIHTALFCLVIVGLAAGLGHLHELSEHAGPTGWMLAYPPAWFAAPLAQEARSAAWSLAGLATIFTVGTFLFAPFPGAPKARRTTTPLGIVLHPLRLVAERVWVRPVERAPFVFVYEALPAERDFVSRTYPLVAVPLAFLLLGADSGSSQDEGLFALLLFAPATYLPMLLLHVPATATPGARWILDTTPLDPAHEAAGARKAVAIRFLAPLYLGLGVLTWLRGDLELALRITPVAAAVGLLTLRVAWPLYVTRPPLSTAASDLGSAWDDARSSGMIGFALVMTFLAVLTWRYVQTPGLAFGIFAAALAIEMLAGAARQPART